MALEKLRFKKPNLVGEKVLENKCTAEIRRNGGEREPAQISLCTRAQSGANCRTE